MRPINIEEQKGTYLKEKFKNNSQIGNFIGSIDYR
jgi:hypothetical protein